MDNLCLDTQETKMQTTKKIAANAVREVRMRALADIQYRHITGLMIDGDAVVREDPVDNGCYVQAWLWVDFADTQYDKELR